MVQKEPSSLSEKSNPSFVNQAGDVDFDWWEIEHSTNDVASEIATAVGSDDSVHIAYFDDVNDNIKYAYFDGVNWVNETVWTHGEVGGKSLIADLDIALDSNNFPFISFRDQPGADYLHISDRQNGFWQNYSASFGQPLGGIENRIIIDSNDDLHVIHDEGANIGYEFSSLTSNTVSPCSTSPGIAPVGGISLAVKSDGLPMIAFVDYTGNVNNLKLAECTANSQWIIQNIQTLNGGIFGLSLALDESDSPIFSYVDTAINSELVYVEMNIYSNIWQTTSLDNGGGSGLGGIGSTSLLINEDDDKYVIYYAGNRVNVAQQIDGIWQTPYFVDAPTGGDSGLRISADIDSFGKPRISYQSNLVNRVGWGLHHIRILPDLRIDSISPNNAELGDTVPVTITGDGFDMLPKYIKHIDITNDFNSPVQDYSIFVENPTYDETDLEVSYHFEDDDLVGVKDTSGNGLDGTINGNPTHDEGVNGGNSLDFDGNDYVSIPGDEFEDIGSDDFTIMMWVRRDGSSSSGYEGIMTNNPSSSSGFTISMPANGVGAGNPSTYSFYPAGGSYISSSLGRDIDVWHHLAFTYDSNSNFLQIYTDGAADGSGTVTIPSSTADLHLGHFYTSGLGPWNGAIDDVKIYSRALSSLEIASYVNSDIRHDYGDIRFIDSDGTSLDYEMLSDGNFMINIPSMSALETRTIHMTYGALGLKSESQPLDEYQLPGELGMEFIDEAIGHWPLDDLGAIEWYGTTFYLDSFASAYDVHNSIAVDSNHNIHISYLDRTNLDLKYVTFDGTNWSSPITIDSNGGVHNSIAIDSNDNIYISHIDETNDLLYMTTNNQGIWQTTQLATNAEDDTSIAIDSSDVIHISYHSGTAGGDLMYTYYDGTIQSSVPLATIGDVGKYSSLAIDSNDNIYVSFIDQTTGDLSLIKNEHGVGWGSIVLLDGYATTTGQPHTSGDIREEISLAIDDDDGIHIVYFDWTFQALRYINSIDGVNWGLPQVLDSSGVPGARNSIAVSPSGEIHVIYYSQGPGVSLLNHASKKDNTWILSRNIANGIYSSIAFDSESNLHFSFFDSGNTMCFRSAMPTKLSTTLEDSSSNSNNASIVDTLTSVPAVFDSGVEFDGIDDYIEINNPPDWYSGSEFTWALWVKLNDVNSDQMFIKHGTASGGSGNGAYLNYYQNKIMFTSPTGQSAQGVMSPQLDQITDISGWNHIALTVDISGTTNLYVNGIDVSLSAYGGSLTGISAPTGSMMIGYDVQYGTQRFDGMMDDIIILERALEPSEISSYYNTSIVSRIFYDFDANPMNTCPGGTVSDYNMAHDAIVHGVPVCSFGYHDESLYLDGINDYLEISSGSWQNSPTASVGYHVNLTSLPPVGKSYGFRSVDSGGTPQAGIFLGITDNGNIDCAIGGQSFNHPTIYTNNLSIQPGQWYHLLCSWDGQNLKLYVDGQLTHEYTHSGSYVMSWDNRNAYLGKFYSGGGNYGFTHGKYDNFAYFDYALSDDVVEELFGQSIIWPITINNHGVLGNGAYYDYDLLLINGSSDYDSLNNFVIVNETTITATIPSNLNLAGSGFYDVLLNGDGDVEICRLANGFEFIITDADGDGWADDVDAFPNDSTQWQDSDGDGYGDNLAGNNSDAFLYDATQWQDSDGDGYGDNLTGNSPDVFPSEPSQWNDTDGDGYGDNQSGFEPDDCVSVWGNSTNGRFGCPDDDGDGLANIDDAFPDDPLRGGDADLDGYDDALDDDCPLIWGNSTIDRIGCVDTDGDGYSDGDLNWTVVNGSDAFPLEVSQWLDSDGDGYGDNSTGFEADQCPQVWGNSTIGQLGCPDNDGDGLSNTEDDCPDSNNSIGSTDTDGDGCLDAEDAFPDDSTEHEDSDGDGIGDNSDPEPGVPLDSDGDGYPDRPGYADSDDCPQISGNSTGELVGCLDTDGDGLADTIDAFPNDANRTTDTDLDGYDDLIEDDCVNEWGNSTIDLLGCLDSDGDGVSDINDLFPEDSTDWNDDDGDGVGNNSDAFPQDANETIDSDGDGIGDNADLFPQDANETVDSDGDGIGDNEDQYPLQDNFIDTDNDGIFDVEDAFVTDPTQWQDADNDGYGDNLTGLLADLFPTDETQWFDLDGDGYGDNWGNATWNLTRLFIWPGMYIENASLADHCPDTWGNSSADGYFGCPDLDGDTIADIYDDEIDLGGENNQTQEIADGDNDGVTDLFDFCPNSLPDAIVDAEGCLVDQDGDGVGDSVDQCPNTQSNVEVNVEGCAISSKDDSDTIIDELLAGDTDAIVRTVGIGAILIAVIGFMQTNFIAAMLPDAFRWVQVFRKKSKLSAEEEMELGHLQSVVQAYFNDVDELKEELFNLKSDLTARFTNGEIKEGTRKLIFTLIGDLLTMESSELKRIAHDDRFFGLAGTTDTKERLEMLEIEKAMRSFDDDSNDEETDSFGADFLDKNSPSPETKGIINEDDGHEYIEHPADSGRWFIRNIRTNMWDEWKD